NVRRRRAFLGAVLTKENAPRRRGARRLSRAKRSLRAGRRVLRIGGAGALLALGRRLAGRHGHERAVLRAVLPGQAELAGAGRRGLGRRGALRILRAGDADAGDERRDRGERGECLHAMPPQALRFRRVTRHRLNGHRGTGFREPRAAQRDGASLSGLPGFAVLPSSGLSSFGAAPVVSAPRTLAAGISLACSGAPILSGGAACCAGGAGSGARVCAAAGSATSAIAAAAISHDPCLMTSLLPAAQGGRIGENVPFRRQVPAACRPPLPSRFHRGTFGRPFTGSPMTILPSAVDPAAPEFRANAERMRALTAELRDKRAEAAQGGPARARERHVARGKLLPRDRVMNLIDPGSPFLELSPLAANGLYDD